VPLFAELRRGCSVAPARAALDRVLRDEVRHRDFGWLLLDWLLAAPFGPRVAELVARELPAMLENLRTTYAPGWIDGQRSLPAEDRAWGLMPGARYAAILARSIERDHLRASGARHRAKIA